MIRLLLVVGVLIGIASSLQCHSCDSAHSCTRPFPVECPPHAKCYSLTHKGKHGELSLIARGCAHNCESLTFVEGGHCTTCHHSDFCNGLEVGIGQGVVMQSYYPEIGGGVAPNPPNSYNIGGGVRPRSASQTSFAMILTLPIFRRVLL